MLDRPGLGAISTLNSEAAVNKDSGAYSPRHEDIHANSTKGAEATSKATTSRRLRRRTARIMASPDAMAPCTRPMIQNKAVDDTDDIKSM